MRDAERARHGAGYEGPVDVGVFSCSNRVIEGILGRLPSELATFEGHLTARMDAKAHASVFVERKKPPTDEEIREMMGGDDYYSGCGW